MIKLPNKKYNIIYADPAWTFKTWSSKGDEKSPKYDLMTIEDIKNMPVDNIADKNCILFIWVTYPLLQEGLDTIKSWNFKYKTCAFSWIKKHSRKPDCVRDRIVQLCGDLPRIELFARQRVDGWDCWGNEV
jgi:N6-adenosine-specific RNA methylase IME4